MTDPDPSLPAWKRSLPNALTLSRVALAAVFFVVLARFEAGGSPVLAGLIDWRLVVAGLIFILAAATDALDGALARRWRVVSFFGRVMDPFADKLLVLGAFVMLAGPGFAYFAGTGPDGDTERVSLSHVAPWMAVVIMARELLITSLRGVFESRRVSFAATTSGKLKMVVQSACIPVVLLLPNIPMAWGRGETIGGPSDWVDLTIRIIVWLTVAITVWSGFPYVMRAVRARGQLKGNE